MVDVTNRVSTNTSPGKLVSTNESQDNIHSISNGRRLRAVNKARISSDLT